MMRMSKLLSAIPSYASRAAPGLNDGQIRPLMSLIAWGNVMSSIIGRLAAAAVIVLAQAGFASAAEVKVFSTFGVKAALEELAPKFEQATGNKLDITWATA